MKKDNIYFGGEVTKNKSLIIKRIVLFIVTIWVISVSYFITFIGGYNKGKKHMNNVLAKKDIELDSYRESLYNNIFNSISNYTIQNPYKKSPILHFTIDDEKASFIIAIAESLNIDPDFCIAILNNENWSLDPYQENNNSNGSTDYGLWQINDSNLKIYGNTNESAFDNKYWMFDEPFDPFNWKHNTWVAIHHIADLYSKYNNLEIVARVYNGGPNNAYKEKGNAANYAKRAIVTYDGLKKIS